MKILVTRPSPSGDNLVKNLNKIGISSWHFPLFEFYPSFTSRSLSKNIHELYKSNFILIFSKSSIYYTNLYLKKHHLHWPFDPKYYTIGKSTATFLYKHIKKKFFIPIKTKIVNIY